MTENNTTAAAVLALTQSLINRQSVTPEDGGCQALIAQRLGSCGFEVEHLPCGEVSNLWAHRSFGGDTSPHLLFAGHTDVVPAGPAEQWRSPPFRAEIRAGKVYGRGAADMKSSLAAMVVATEQLLSAPTAELSGTLSFLLTSDEEGPAVHGTRHVVDVLAERGIFPDYCIVGEPSSNEQLGDVVRCGRRGSLNARMTIHGVQGHVAYPDDAVNPIHQSLAALDRLTRHHWDSGNQYYPPTSLQVSNITGGTGATNVIPGALQVLFNLRFNTEQNPEGIQQQVEALLAPCNISYTIDWELSGLPFLTPSGVLTAAVAASIQAENNVICELSTSGGTSDGRFIACWANHPSGHQVEVVELGPGNATIHKIDECVSLAELAPLANIYQRIMQRLLVNGE